MLYLQKSNKVSHVDPDPAKGRKLNYQELEDRMKTFKLSPQWEGPLDYQSMAEAGFVYTGQEDLVSCFHCNIKLDRWSKDMEPLLRHKEESPACSFMRQRLQAVKGERGKTKSVVAPSKPLNSRLTSSIGQLQSSSLVTSKSIHTVVTGLNEPRLSYGGSFDDRPGASLPITPENYQCEAERIRSFVGWPLNEAVHPEQLARVGFVYTGEGALVQCFQCGVKYRHWYKGDVPLNIHQKCNPRCAFLQSLGSKSSSIEQKPTRSYIQPESLGSNAQTEEVSKHSLQFPDYSDEAIRLQSFKHWGGVLPVQELAEGGFYMIGRRDVVRCFSCKVVVHDWERSDNIVGEHHRLSPNCLFLKETFLSSKRNSEKLSPYSSIEKTNQPALENTAIKIRESHSSQLPSVSETASGAGIKLPSLSGQVSSNCRLDDSCHIPASEQHSAAIVQPKKVENTATVQHLPPSKQLPPSSDIKLPPSMKSRCSSKSPDDDDQEEITGIRYPPSWGQHRSMSPQGAARKMSEGSDESFHSAESHQKADYTMMRSLDPPKTKIMVSCCCMLKLKPI